MDTSCQATRTSFWWDSQTAEFSCVLSHPSYVRPKSKTAAEGFGNFFFFFFPNTKASRKQVQCLNRWMNKDTTGLMQGGKAQYGSSPLTGQISLWCLLLSPCAFSFPHDTFFSFLVSHICRVTFSTSDQPYLTVSSLQYSKPVKEYIFLRYLKATRHLTYSKYTKLLGLTGLHFLPQHLPE